MTLKNQQLLMGFTPHCELSLERCYNLALSELDDNRRLIHCRNITEGITGLKWQPGIDAKGIQMSREWIFMAILEAYEAGRDRERAEGGLNHK